MMTTTKESKNTARPVTLYDTTPAVAALNAVPGFDPRRFLRRAISPETNQPVLRLDLRYKRLWFRLACPQGRLKLVGQRITEQLAIFEAMVYADRKDSEPISTCTATCTRDAAPGGLYVEAAQEAALNTALTNAGFGIQFVDVETGGKAERYGSEVPLKEEIAVQAAPPVVEQPAAQEQPLAPEVDETPASIVAAPAPVPVAEEKTPAAPKQPIPQPTPKPAAPERAIMVEDDDPPAPAAPAKDNTILLEKVTQPAAPAAPAYTASTPVEEILQRMTLEEARNVYVDSGTCNGWTMQQVVERRPPILRWYLTAYTGSNNLMRAAAQILLDEMQAQKAG